MKKHILAIDDSKAMRYLLQTVLAKNYQVTTAPDGCSAMYWLSKRNLPDLIIVDVQLPDMHDWELIEQLTSSGLYQDIPLIVLSAFDSQVTKAKCKELGITEYYIKPFNPIDLMETVDRVINKSEPASSYALHANH